MRERETRTTIGVASETRSGSPQCVQFEVAMNESEGTAQSFPLRGEGHAERACGFLGVRTLPQNARCAAAESQRRIGQRIVISSESNLPIEQFHPSPCRVRRRGRTGAACAYVVEDHSNPA